MGGYKVDKPGISYIFNIVLLGFWWIIDQVLHSKCMYKADDAFESELKNFYLKLDAFTLNEFFIEDVRNSLYTLNMTDAFAVEHTILDIRVTYYSAIKEKSFYFSHHLMTKFYFIVMSLLISNSIFLFANRYPHFAVVHFFIVF